MDRQPCRDLEFALCPRSLPQRSRRCSPASQLHVCVRSVRVRETHPVSSVDLTRVNTTTLARLPGDKACLPVPFDPHEARGESCLP